MATRGHEKYYNYIQFVTTNTYNRIRIFSISKYCKVLLKNLNFYRKKYRFKLIGYVIMPDHCHLLILPDNEIGNISQILHDWKSYTAQIILRDLRLTGQDALSPRGIKASTLRETQAPCLGSYTAEQGAPLSIDFKTQEPYNIETQAPCLGNDRINILKSAGRLWQERFDSFSIYSDKKLKEKLNYIHNNPIRAGLVKNLDYYPWSSYQNYYLNNNLLIRIDY